MLMESLLKLAKAFDFTEVLFVDPIEAHSEEDGRENVVWISVKALFEGFILKFFH